MRVPRPASGADFADIDPWLSHVPRAGVVVSALFVLAGGALYLRDQGGSSGAERYASFRGEPVGLRSVAGIVREAAALRGPGLIQFGLLVLVATPMARVVFSFAGFVRERDRLYLAITATVLLLLLWSLAGVG